MNPDQMLLPQDTGMSEEEMKKEELRNDDVFKKYLMMYKIKQPLGIIYQKIKGDGIFDPALINLFATPKEIEDAK
jgi:hypothetical protein